MTADELLEQFHTQVRLADRDAAPGFVVDRDGPVHRTYPPDAAEHGAMVECPEGLGDDPDHWIARQVEFFGGRGPAGGVEDLRLRRAGRPARAAACGPGSSPRTPRSCCSAGAPTSCTTSTCPTGTRLREIASDEDWERVRVSVDAVWGEDTSWVNDALRAEQRRDPDLLTAAVVEDAATLEVLSYAVLRLQPGTEFCGLWGGSTLPEWRGRGLYRALTSPPCPAGPRPRLPYARVDTSPDSRPILVGLGMHAVADTRPYLLEPPVVPERRSATP